jgi:hypothetical protein
MYRVEWLPAVAMQLQTLYAAADTAGQAELSAAIDVIDAALRDSPHTAGESRDPPVRILFAAPLTVYFRADFRSQVSTVLKVVRYRRRTS